MQRAIYFVILLIFATTSKAGEVTGEGRNDFYLMEKPSQRLEQPQKYFSHEYKQINTRRGIHESKMRPALLTGLALSGGGIRSSAFQLGILSGLYRYDNTLARVDYISSVSGASWANGAYWAWTLSDAALFDCLDKTAKEGLQDAQCEAATFLNIEQPFAELPIDENKLRLKARKRQWKEFIEGVYLPECNLDAEVIKKNDLPTECARNYRGKPYIIINASHSAPTLQQGWSEKNMPFQFTFDYMGTIADCYPQGSCGEEKNKGFFVQTLSQDFTWVNNSFFRSDQAENSLSAAMAASSGVVSGALLLSYQYELYTNTRTSIFGNQRGDKIKEIRKEIVLSDGGKSENLGLLPLLERGVDLIVVSNMGKDADPYGRPWEDLENAAKQAKNLLNCEVQIPPPVEKKESTFIHETAYTCPNSTGTLLNVKATYDNAELFIKYLEDNDYADLATYLNITDKDKNSTPENRFPQTKTFTQFYDEELIRAYYLFGRWIAETSLAEIVVQKQLN